MSTSTLKSTYIKKPQNSILLLIIILISITTVYQLRPFLDDSTFLWISIPAYSLVPGILVGFSLFLTIKSFQKKHFQSKSFLFLTIGFSFWFIAEQIWSYNLNILDITLFPSISDFLFLGAYPLIIAFLFISLKPKKNQ